MYTCTQVLAAIIMPLIASGVFGLFNILFRFLSSFFFFLFHFFILGQPQRGNSKDPASKTDMLKKSLSICVVTGERR